MSINERAAGGGLNAIATCKGKQRFQTPQLANAVLRRGRKRKSASPDRARRHAYRCPVCGFFHLGNSTL